MKIEVINKTIETFEKVDVGEAFAENGTVYLRIEANGQYANKKNQDGLAVDLLTGVIVAFHYFDEVIILHDAKVIY